MAEDPRRYWGDRGDPPGGCRVRAAHPMRSASPDGWTVWAVLHDCGATETIACPAGSGAPRRTRCPAADKGADG